MTMAVYRILKMKLARLLAPDDDLGWPGTDDRKGLIAFFTDPSKSAAVDRILPTAFHADEDDPSLPETRERKNATLLLWKASEELKRKLAIAASAKEAKGQAAVAFKAANESLGLAQLREIQKRAGTSVSPASDFPEKAQDAKISTAEVDALIEAETREAVRYARCLIEARLGAARRSTGSSSSATPHAGR